MNCQFISYRLVITYQLPYSSSLPLPQPFNLNEMVYESLLFDILLAAII